jgi:DNA-binding MarR family transcriptional regulator
MTGPLGLATEFADSNDSTGLLLWRVTNAWQAAQRRTLKPFGLTHVQFVLLASLAWLETDAPVTQQALADQAGTDPMMTSQVVRVLEARGLVQRLTHPQDGRAKQLRITKLGKDLANSAVVAVEACDQQFFEPLSASRKAFTQMLSQLD